MKALREGVITDLPVFLVIGLYVATAYALYIATGIPAPVDLPTSWGWLFRASLLYLVPASLVVLFRAARDPDRKLLDGGEWLRRIRQSNPASRLVGFALLCALLPIWMHAFLRFKVAIPTIRPFSMDELFMRADRLLHFGYHPFELLQPLLGQPAMTQLIDIIYYTWFFAIWITFVWQALHGTGMLRSQFLMAFSLCWILLGHDRSHRSVVRRPRVFRRRHRRSRPVPTAAGVPAWSERGVSPHGPSGARYALAGILRGDH